MTLRNILHERQHQTFVDSCHWANHFVFDGHVQDLVWLLNVHCHISILILSHCNFWSVLGGNEVLRGSTCHEFPLLCIHAFRVKDVDNHFKRPSTSIKRQTNKHLWRIYSPVNSWHLFSDAAHDVAKEKKTSKITENVEPLLRNEFKKCVNILDENEILPNKFILAFAILF